VIAALLRVAGGDPDEPAAAVIAARLRAAGGDPAELP